MKTIDCDVDSNIYHESFLDYYSNTFHIYPNLITFKMTLYFGINSSVCLNGKFVDCVDNDVFSSSLDCDICFIQS